jgi:hypothetical protein
LPPDDWEKKKASEQTEAKEAGLLRMAPGERARFGSFRTAARTN